MFDWILKNNRDKKRKEAQEQELKNALAKKISNYLHNANKINLKGDESTATEN